MKHAWFTLMAAGSFAAHTFGAPIDLSTWTELTLNFPGGQAAGNWTLKPGNTVVVQEINADPSFYLNNLNQTKFSMDGTWKAGADGDDDYMGFVFGYQNSSQFYLFDWKQGTQNYVGTTAAEGMTVKKFTGATGNGLTDLGLDEMWENQTDFGDMKVLASNHGSTKGWVDNKVYDFHLDFNQVAGQFSIVVKDGATELWNVTVADSTYTGGQFGFYNYSQSQVEYAGFVQTGGIPVGNGVPDSGSAMALLGLGLAGLVVAGRRRM